ncbi:hypothetical protein ACXYRQ_00350 [Mycoplasma sp. 394]
MNLSDVLSILSKNIKRKIILHLFTCHEQECDVLTLAQTLKSKQANISKHLSDLKKKNIIDANKKGLFTYYFLNKKFKKKYFDLLNTTHTLNTENVDCKCINDGHIK